jgi:hypothetical protein
VAALAVPLGGCGRRDSPEEALRRTTESFLLVQIRDLEALAKKAESGELDTANRLAIGIAESAAKTLLNASLPQERVVGGAVRLRVESAEPYFRGANAALVFQATARSVQLESAAAKVQLAGRLGDFRIEEGKLRAAVDISHFKLIESSLADVAGQVLEDLVSGHLDKLQGVIPDLEIPVRLEQSIEIGGLEEGVVVTKPGRLPLEIAVADVLPVNERLWVLLDVKAGPWQRGGEKEAGR